MLRYIKAGLPAVFLFTFSGNSFADDWGFSGGVGVKYQTVDFSISGDTLKPLFVSNTLNFTAVKDRIYLNIEYDISTKDHQELSIDANEAQFIDMSRSDTNFTFGYILNNSTSVFFGYKSAALDVKLDTVVDPDGGTPAPPPAPVVGNAVRAQDVEFKDAGFYIGASYSHNVGDTGSFSYSAAYADMDGEVSIRGAEYQPATNTLFVFSERTEGTTSGLSLGITWNDSFTETANYSVALKVNLYEFEDEALSIGSDDLSTDETFTILSIGLRKYF